MPCFDFSTVRAVQWNSRVCDSVQGSHGLLIGSPKTPISGLGILLFLEIYQNHYMGLQLFSGKAFLDSYFEISSEIPGMPKLTVKVLHLPARI